MEKYIKLKALEECYMFDDFQKKNQGKIFRVLSEDINYYCFNNNDTFNIMSKDRFKPHSSISLPDELFRI